MKVLVVVLVLAACACAAAQAQDPALALAPAVYSVETTVLLDEARGAGAGVGRGAELGYRLHAELAVAPLGADGTDTLLHFHLRNVKLHARGAHPHADWQPRPSPWDTWPREPFHALLRAGRLRAAHLPPTDHPDAANYKRALLSLFQFQLSAGEHEETDVSGTCQVLYEVISEHEVRKIKRECQWSAGDNATSAAPDTWAGLVVPRRVTRYTRGAQGELRALHAEEVVELRVPGAALKARSWHRLQRLDQASPAQVPALPRGTSLPAALEALPPAAPLTLQLPAAGAGDTELELDDEELLLEPAVENALGIARGARRGDGADEEEGWEAAGRGGDAAQAAGVLEALGALRAAPARALTALLDKYHDRPALLVGVVRLLGLAGTGAAHAAAGALLRLRTEPLAALADVYLAALALAPQPAEEVVRDVLQLGGTARSERVRSGALLAAAAAAPEQLGDAVRDTITAQLARCKDDECLSTRLLALGNLRRGDTVPLLLRHAETGARGPALAALGALGAAPPHALPPPACRRLLRLALSGRPLAVRALALDLGVVRYLARDVVPVHLAGVARELHARGPHELRRVFRQRLEALAQGGHAGARALLRRLPAELRGWAARAHEHAGTSSVMARSAGWGAGGWRAALQSVQVAAGGLLQRGEVRLQALDAANVTHDALTVQLWTSGLEALAGGGEAEEEGQGEEAGAGLAFTVAGVRMLPITLFTGQGELMGHVWAGTGSTATPALRAAAPLPVGPGAGGTLVVPLGAGAALRLDAAGALAAALDAQAQVSLWSRAARSLLELRGGVALRARVRLRTAWADLRARSAATSQPTMNIAADIDFYDKVDLCVRVHIHDHHYTFNTTMSSVVGAREWRVRRSRGRVQPRAGRTLALGARNDAACRALPAHD